MLKWKKESKHKRAQKSAMPVTFMTIASSHGALAIVFYGGGIAHEIA